MQGTQDMKLATAQRANSIIDWADEDVIIK